MIAVHLAAAVRPLMLSRDLEAKWFQCFPLWLQKELLILKLRSIFHKHLWYPSLRNSSVLQKIVNEAWH